MFAKTEDPPTKIKPYRSCLCDWFIILCLFIVTAILESPKSEPYHQCVPGYTTQTNSTSTNPNTNTYYPCGSAKDPELHYPYKPNTITSTLLFALAFGPWIFTILINMLMLYCMDPLFRYKAVLKNIEILFRMVLFSVCGTEAVVSVIKFSVGRPRPNFYAMIKPDRSQDDHKQARMSFPSGHSSLSFALLFLLSLNLYCAMNYVQIRFRKQKKNTLRVSINNPHSYFYLQFWWMLRYYLLISVILVFCPTFLAIYVACTRVTDYWHHYGDIAVGSLLGIAGATISFMIYRDELYPLNIMDYKHALLNDSSQTNANVIEEYDIIHEDRDFVVNTDGKGISKRNKEKIDIDKNDNQSDDDIAPTMIEDKVEDNNNNKTSGEYNKFPMPNQNVSNRNVSKDMIGNEDEQ